MDTKADQTVQAIIFDFDYTLADSSPGVFDCINFALGEMGLEHISTEAACRTIGLSLSETFLTLGKHHEPHRCAEFHQLFVRRADDVMVNLTTLYDSVPVMVEALRQRGLRLGIVSTKYRRRINEVLIREGVMHGFEVVIGGDDVKQHKPHPQGLFEAMEKLECPPESVVYVGDSVVDAELAQRAGVSLVVVLSGVTPREHFEGYDSIAILESVSQLPKVI
jgi:phosphoglycolate phosphatase